MIRNKKINLAVIKKVARVLGELNTQVAYVGGATVCLYADEPAADDVRPTRDIDLVVNVATFGQLTALQHKLGQKGIYIDPRTPITCRFTFEDVVIDVMATKQIGWAPSNEWFEPGFQNMEDFRVDAETVIRIFPLPYFLATKFSAYGDRGRDPRTSQDFEDIVYVLDNRINLVNEILAAPEDVRSYLVVQLSELQSAEKVEAIQAHLSPFTVAERYAVIEEKIKQIINGALQH